MSCAAGQWPRGITTISWEWMNRQTSAPYLPGTATPVAQECDFFRSSGDNDDDDVSP